MQPPSLLACIYAPGFCDFVLALDILFVNHLTLWLFVLKLNVNIIVFICLLFAIFNKSINHNYSRKKFIAAIISNNFEAHSDCFVTLRHNLNKL